MSQTVQSTVANFESDHRQLTKTAEQKTSEVKVPGVTADTTWLLIINDHYYRGINTV